MNISHPSCFLLMPSMISIIIGVRTFGYSCPPLMSELHVRVWASGKASGQSHMSFIDKSTSPYVGALTPDFPLSLIRSCDDVPKLSGNMGAQSRWDRIWHLTPRTTTQKQVCPNMVGCTHSRTLKGIFSRSMGIHRKDGPTTPQSQKTKSYCKIRSLCCGCCHLSAYSSSASATYALPHSSNCFTIHPRCSLSQKV